jgi:transposase InsO family protein
MCRVLEVSRSGFYAWLERPESKQAEANQALLSKIRTIHKDNRGVYGSPRIHEALVRQDVICGKNRVARLMKDEGIRAKGKKKFKPQTTDSNHSFPIAENLIKQDFSVAGPNQLWLVDITYVPTGEGWMYLASIIDAYSRLIIGWAMADHMRTELALDALGMAVKSRGVAEGLIHHSDRGSQYASNAYQEELRRLGIACSMSGVGNCYDNAMKESFFHTLKVECVHGENLETRSQAKSVIFDYIECFYNRVRFHSSLGYKTPIQFDQEAA